MRRCLLFVITLAAVALLDARPSLAGAWCAVSDIGRGTVTENCRYNNFEACRREVIAGNRGFCRQNAAWPGWHSGYGEAPRKARKRSKR